MKPIRCLIVGCGVSGRAAARLAAARGMEFDLLDQRDDREIHAFAASLDPIPQGCFFGPEAHTKLSGRYEIAVLSPGIRRDSRLFDTVRFHADCVQGELEFALSLLECPYVAITGTNGKTTTTELTAHLFEAAGLRVRAAGNIGHAISDVVLESGGAALDFAVVEISSFQLETVSVLHPVAAAVLNLASDHLDRHGTLQEYASVKFRIWGPESARIINGLLTETAVSILSPAGPFTKFASHPSPDAEFFFDGTRLCCAGRTVLRADELQLSGLHNMENALASLALLAAVRGRDILFTPRVQAALRDFSPSPHRIETVGEARGIRFVNDSKATNPHAVNAAVRSLSGERNIRVILGGLDKGMRFDELLCSTPRLASAYLIGEAKHAIRDVLSGTNVPVVECDSLRDAVSRAAHDAFPGDVVLLSPACASMDMFRDYKDRGEQFRALALAWIANGAGMNV